MDNYNPMYHVDVNTDPCLNLYADLANPCQLIRPLGPLLLTWFNFNLSMDK